MYGADVELTGAGIGLGSNGVSTDDAEGVDWFT